MKKFVFKYSPTVWILLIVAALIFSVATIINIYDATVFFSENLAKTVFAITVATISAFLTVLSAAAIFYGRYVVKGKYLYFHFGLIFTKTDINDIFQLTEFKAQNKLVIYFKNEKYSVAVIDEKLYADFYDALKAVNPDIVYTVQSAEEK